MNVCHDGSEVILGQRIESGGQRVEVGVQRCTARCTWRYRIARIAVYSL